MFDRLYPFRELEWRRYFHQYTTPRDWKRGARDIPFGLGAKTLYVDGTNGNDHNDGLSWKTAFKTIQHAIDEADSWTNIYIKAGTYSESLSISSDLSSLSLFGEAWKAVIIDGGSSSALDLNSHSNFLQNLYFKSSAGLSAAALLKGDRNFLQNCFFENSGSTSYDLVLDGNDNFVSRCETAGLATEASLSFFGKRNEISSCRLFASNADDVLIFNEGADDSKVFDCLFQDASEYAVSLSSNTNRNLIFHNNFINNSNAVLDDGNDNKILENFYDDHSNVDNGFGIAKEPYSFTGGSDPRPVVCRNGWLALSWADADLVAAIKAVTDNLPDDGSLNDLASIFSNQKKYWHWHALRSDEYRVVSGTWSLVDHPGQHLGCVLSNQSAAALNDEIRIPFSVPSTDSLTLNIRCYTDSYSAIITIYVDGQSQGTLDLYSSLPAYNTIKTISITPARAGINILRLRVSDRNSSSSDYRCQISEMWLS